MNNQTIGIAAVFAFTFILFVLRHFFLSIGRTNKNRHVTPTTFPQRHASNQTAESDDWILWTPDWEPRKISSKQVRDR
ncbi:MAG TPA: hypothetical protein VNO24_08850 [Blastocatellia bacterium]|nr:hypothetical protein [Blastocatellia bacterium]